MHFMTGLGNLTGAKETGASRDLCRRRAGAPVDDTT
jgi:hypothetical protein